MMEQTQEQVQVQDMPKNAYEEKKLLQHQAYVELKKDIGMMTATVGEHRRLINSTHVLLKNYLARQDAIIKVLTTANVTTQETFDSFVDENLGLRLRASGETIEAGDVVWVKYDATVEGTDKNFSDPELPVRAGSNTVVFDTMLVGKTVGSEFEFDVPLTRGEDAGKNVKYKVGILKAKASLGEKNGSVESETQAEN